MYYVVNFVIILTGNNYDSEVSISRKELFMTSMEFIEQYLITPNIKLYPRLKEIMSNFYIGQYRELVAVLGRRSGKDYLATLLLLAETRRLLEIPNPFEYYNIPNQDTIYQLAVCNSAEEARSFFTELKLLVTRSEYFRDEITKIEQNKIWLPRRNRSGYICLMVAHANSSNLLGKRYFTLVFNEIASFPGQSGDRIYNALIPSTADFKHDGVHESRTIIVSSPRRKGDLLYNLISTAPDYRLICQLPTWEVNTDYTEEMLRQENQHMSDGDFGCEFGSKFQNVVENITISIRILSDQLEQLKRVARKQAYENDCEISYVDIIRTAISDYLKGVVAD
jgi:hypothetical protein